MVAVVDLIAVHASSGIPVAMDSDVDLCVSQWCMVIAYTAEVRSECAHDVQTLQAQDLALRGTTQARLNADDEKAPNAEQVIWALGPPTARYHIASQSPEALPAS